MSWTVPTGCYYAVAEDDPQWHWEYYGAGATVPTQHAPNNPYVDVRDLQFFILIDFTNGYIYTGVQYCTITIKSNNTFTVAYGDYGMMGYNHTNIIASSEALAQHHLTFAGVAFNFGNGSGMMNKSALLHSSRSYEMRFSFAGRSITSVTIPTGVDSLWNAFDGCTSLTTAPTIPSGVTDMGYCFKGCTSLTTASSIPSSVTSMLYTFSGCTSLTTAPAIPSSVTNLNYCFKDCTSLEGAVTINASPSGITEVFANTVNDIVLLGSGGTNATIASQYANVYVWELSAIITARRQENSLTTVDVSVEVTRFKTGTLSSLVLSKDGTAQAVTWNDPTLSITSIPTTFTTTLLNIAEGDTPTISVIATDQYGSATAVSVKIPIAFYTMDVQAGGKEIAFGAIADDDLTSHPNGLFRCNMDVLLAGTTTEVENPYYSLDTTASPGTTDGDLYAAITDLSWQSDVIAANMLDDKALLTKIMSKLPTLVVEVVNSSSVNINANSASENSFSVAKSGYTPLGIVGYNIAGSGISAVAPYRMRVIGSTAYYGVRNYGSGQATNVVVQASILYVKWGS